ncbi:MAG: nucleotidyltransferase [Candidatus Eisenbacteria sp.]|nr:nucleotidyltransferase [Candidatus Eisenbacteria bacterium]
MLNPDYRDILSAFSDKGVEYMLVGAYALAAHGLPRATGDLDLWVRATPENAHRLWLALAEFGAPLDRVAEDDLQTADIVLQIGIAPCRIDILTSIDGVEFDDAWPRRSTVEIEGIRVGVIGRDDLIRNKRVAGRPQDVADISRLEGGA